MKKLTAWLQGIFPLLQNMFLPALLAMGAIIWFYAHDGISPAARMTLHHLFYLLSFASFLILLYFNSVPGCRLYAVEPPEIYGSPNIFRHP